MADAKAERCEVLEDLVVPNRFLWIEWWPTDDEAERVLTSERFSTLMAAIRVLGKKEAVWRVRAVDVAP